LKVEIHRNERLYEGFFTLHRTELSFEKFNGDMSRPVTRLAVERGDAAAVLCYHSLKRTILLVKQFRFPMYLADPGQAWLLEVVAGSIEAGQQPEETALREIEEEIGYAVPEKKLRYVTTCCPSPGGLTERIHLYLADVHTGVKKNNGGGLEEETEDIQVVELDYAEAFAKTANGEIRDAKSLICLLWFQRLLECEGL